MKPLQSEFTGRKPTNTDQFLGYNALMNGRGPGAAERVLGTKEEAQVAC